MKKKSLHFCSSPLIQVLCQLSRDKFVPLEYSAHNNGSSSKQARLKLNRKDEREEAVAATCRIAVSMAQDSRDVSICHECMHISPVIDLYTLLCMDLQKKLKLWGLISLSASCMHYPLLPNFSLK